ncbi:hypothetical protein D3C87_1802270 [compost metagenome]
MAENKGIQRSFHTCRNWLDLIDQGIHLYGVFGRARIHIRVYQLLILPVRYAYHAVIYQVVGLGLRTRDSGLCQVTAACYLILSFFKVESLVTAFYGQIGPVAKSGCSA